MKDEIDQEEVAKRRGIYFPAFSIYGGSSGLFDYGPYGSLIKDNIQNIWKEMIFSEGPVAMLDSPALTLQNVLKASGHYDRFFDYSVQCKSCNTKFRADDIVESLGLKVILDRDYLNNIIREKGIKCPKCGGEFDDVRIHKLMFQVDQGENMDPLFLRPETAQGIFVNFKEFYRFFREKLPFAVIQIGRGYRNEISPRRGLYRLREFNMMECEVFLDPKDEKWVKEPYDDVKIHYLTNKDEDLFMTPKEAYEKGIIKSQPLAYFTGFAFKFYSRIGLDVNKIRFRQHKKEDLSHYSSDTWDAEALTDIGWIEITGIAHRGTYDVGRHIEYSARDLYAQRLVEPHKEKKIELEPNFKEIKRDFGDKAGEIIKAINNGNSTVFLNNKQISLEKYIIRKEVEVTVDRESFVPIVVEPSFGLDRIIYALLDHNFDKREENGYVYLKIPPQVSPFVAGVYPLFPKEDLEKVAKDIYQKLLNDGFKVIYDDSGSIGKRYARYDEVGVPFGITVDYDTLKDSTVTIRFRDTTEQIRVSINDLTSKLRELLWTGKKN